MNTFTFEQIRRLLADRLDRVMSHDGLTSAERKERSSRYSQSAGSANDQPPEFSA